MSNTVTTPTVESLAQLVSELQGQLKNAAESYRRLEDKLAVMGNGPAPKKNKPNTFTGKGSVISWITHMDNYLGDSDDMEALNLAASYLSGSAHEWWIVHSTSSNGKNIETWSDMKNALKMRFDTLNKEKVARDKLSKWRQVKDVQSFNDDFQKILLDISNINMEEKIDRYTRGLKPYIWKELCTKDYTELTEAMKDAERVEAAHRRTNTNIVPRNGVHNKQTPKSDSSSQAVPMEIGNTEMSKLSKEEREECMKKGLCLRCRQPGHIARNCPKGKRD